jgi:hypothetical protein
MTKRIEELEAIIAQLRTALVEAEAALQKEKSRLPEIGDYVRCPLTNFFGRVTKVTPRPHGRPWVEITPYLTPDLMGTSTLDLFDSWELIDPPRTKDTARSPEEHYRLPPIESIAWPSKARTGHKFKARLIVSGERSPQARERQRVP